MRCIGRTKKSKRCKNDCKVLFCHHHRCQWLIAIFSLFTVIATLVGFYQDAIKPILEKEKIRQEALEGILKAEKEENVPIKVKFGPVNFQIENIYIGDEKAKEFDVSKLWSLGGTIQPFKIKLFYNELLVSTELFDIDGKLVGKIENSQWIINKNNYFTKKHDAHYLEIIDQFSVPVVQVEYTNSKSIEINGAFNTGNEIIFLRDGTIERMDISPDGRKKIETEDKLTVIEKYKLIGKKLKPIKE